ncbi:hypothetical protein L596_022095 [Steinernema carpocapsae]|uniref:Uncharacterized protein n=1 Tax=Steinernema carpocapsae TaxID=34508 RepID=A0A4U5MLK1_STECR|nr:hypothetical protein L596_022095 [Steinernema carpocapsae]
MERRAVEQFNLTLCTMLYTDSTTISGNHRIRLNCTNFLIQPKYYQNDVAQTFQNTKMRTIGFRAKA